MTAAAAVNIMTPRTEKAIDVLQPTVSPKSLARSSTPVMMMKPVDDKNFGQIMIVPVV